MPLPLRADVLVHHCSHDDEEEVDLQHCNMMAKSPLKCIKWNGSMLASLLLCSSKNCFVGISKTSTSAAGMPRRGAIHLRPAHMPPRPLLQPGARRDLASRLARGVLGVLYAIGFVVKGEGWGD